MIAERLCRVEVTMALDSICRSAARFAAFAAIVVLLLQASCPAQFVAMAKVDALNPENADCHQPAPAKPDAPSSEHNCCNGDHYPEALLSAAQAVPLPFAAAIADEAYPQFALLPNRRDSMSASVSRPPGPLPLRI
jgi:hypothetical protein